MRTWADKTGIHAKTLVDWIGIDRSKYYQWKDRYGKVNEHNAWVPRDHWLEDWEKQAIIAYQQAHPLEGYRRLTYMMMDADIVAVSPASVYRVLKKAGLLAPVERQTLEKRHGLRPALKTARALAYGRVVPQYLRHVLLPVQRPGRLQPVHRPLGDPRGDDRRGTSKSSSSGPRNFSRRPGRGSSPTTARSSSPGTSRSSSGSAA